jgi:hypothetical protein
MIPGVGGPGCGVGGPGGDPALTCVEYGEDAVMEDVTDKVEVLTLEAGRRTSCGS